MTTQEVCSGTIAPVKILTASPFCKTISALSPAFISPTILKCFLFSS